MRIKVFTTGGSLDKGYSTRESAFVVMEPQVGRIFETARVAFEYEVESLFRKDSLEMKEEDRKILVEKVREDPSRHILITHGTDTMALTGQRLSQVTGKTIVLTGAMQPAAFTDSDGPFNLGFAAAALQVLPHGVYLVMNGRIFRPDRVRKNLEENRFEEVR